MKNFKILFLAFLATSIFALTSCGDDDSAGPTITVSGVVSDDLGNPLEDASITVEDDDSQTTTTNADGTYSLTVEEGSNLVFAKDGYVSTVLFAADIVNATLNRGSGAFFAESFDANGNSILDPAFGASSIQPSADLGAMATIDGQFQTVSYKGAVDPSGTPWYDGWSFYSRLVAGETTSAPLTLGNIVDVTDADIQNSGSTSITWTNDNTYVLDGLVFINEGQTLNIEGGTIIQGKSGEAENATALIVARGGKINAMGTADAPVIFTYEGDTGESSASDNRGLWGGLIILGRASLNSNPGESAIEGIPTTETRGLYGGNDDADNSGVLSYVSIRHGGTLIGTDNEINGLTLGGVGTGTTIEYVEVIGNKDDGIEWFGGTVSGRHLISAFCADDGLDYDEGYRGGNQFVIVHQDPTVGAADRGGEHDGGTDPETGTPFATPTFVNVTSIGNPDSRTLTFRDNAGGKYQNSIFTGYGRGVDIEDLEGQDQDSFKQWQDGLLELSNNVFFNIGAGDRADAIFKVSN